MIIHLNVPKEKHYLIDLSENIFENMRIKRKNNLFEYTKPMELMLKVIFYVIFIIPN